MIEAVQTMKALTGNPFLGSCNVHHLCVGASDLHCGKMAGL